MVTADWFGESSSKDNKKTPSKRDLLSLPNTGLRLLFDEGESHSSARIALQWCLDADIQEYIGQHREQGGKVYIFVCVEDKRKKTWHTVAQMSDKQVLVTFLHPGIHTIRGTIVIDAHKHQIERFLTLRDSGRYDSSFNEIRKNAGDNGVGLAEMQIDVSDGLFEKPLSAWEEWWLRLWLGPMLDHCGVVRRRLFAYLIQGPCVVAWYAVWVLTSRLIACVWLSLILWKRKILWSAIIHPFEYDLKDVLKHEGCNWKARQIGSLIMYDADGKPTSIWMGTLWAFFPPVHLALALAVRFVTYRSHAGFLEVLAWAYGHLFLIPLAAILATIAIWRIIGPAVWKMCVPVLGWLDARFHITEKLDHASGAFDKFIIDPVSRFFEEREDRHRARHMQEFARELDFFSCERAPEGGGLRPVADLRLSPVARMKVAWQDLKKTCKPRARY